MVGSSTGGETVLQVFLSLSISPLTALCSIQINKIKSREVQVTLCGSWFTMGQLCQIERDRERYPNSKGSFTVVDFYMLYHQYWVLAWQGRHPAW